MLIFLSAILPFKKHGAGEDQKIEQPDAMQGEQDPRKAADAEKADRRADRQKQSGDGQKKGQKNHPPPKQAGIPAQLRNYGQQPEQAALVFIGGAALFPPGGSLVFVQISNLGFTNEVCQ